MEVKQRFVESEGHRLACLVVNEHLDSPEQPCIVFIHGVLASVNFWLDCVPHDFREERAWYSLSLPAHYPSTVPADFEPDQVDDEWFFRVMNGALKALLGNRKAIIVGHSTGGFSGLNLAIRQSPHVLGVISIGGFHHGRWGGVEGMLVKLAGQGNWAKGLFMANLAIAKRSRFVARIFASLLTARPREFRSNPLGLRMLENIRPHTRRQDAAALFKLFNGISRLDIADQLHRISIPCYLFAGTHDPVVDAKQSLVLAGEVPHAKTVVFRDIGHMPFMEATETCFSKLEQAIAEIVSMHQAISSHSFDEVKHHELSPV